MKRISTFLFAIFMAYSLFAQSPEKMSYQAVVRDINGNLITNETINMQISILQGSASGTAVYVETQSVLTNINGLLSIEIGMGDVQSGSFSAINWAEGPFFLKTETDPEGGTNYSITGISQLLSVPYALHAKTAENVANESDPVFSASPAADVTQDDIVNLDNLSGVNTGDQDLSGIAENAQAIQDTAAQIRADIPDVNGFITTEVDPVYTASEAANITAGDITNLGNLSGINTGDQDITGIGMNTQAIMDTAAQIRGDIPDVSGFITEEVDPVYTASVAAGITGTDTSYWNNKLSVEVDGSVSNEIQFLSAGNDTIYLTDGGYVKLPTAAMIADADGDTKIQVEESDDEDIIRFDLGGSEKWMMRGAALENMSNNNSLFIGYESGLNVNIAEGDNTFIGYQSGKSSLSGNKNVAVGYQTLCSNTIGSFSVAMGYCALASNTSGGTNVAIGRKALFSNTEGIGNLAIGQFALLDNISGGYNIGLGVDALYHNTEGSNNIAIGPYSMKYNTTGYCNISNGLSAMYNNTTGYYNIGTGFKALYNNTSGNYNVAYGYSALYSNTEGSSNIAIGTDALNKNINGGHNFASGERALYNNTSGGENIAIGLNSLYYNTNGWQNIALGTNALHNNTSGDFNLAIGCKALEGSTAMENVGIGAYALQNNVLGQGNVAVGIQAGYDPNDVNYYYSTFLGFHTKLNAERWNVTMLGSLISGAQCTGNNQVILGNTQVQQIRAQVSGITTYSDERFKTQVKEDVSGLDFILKLKPVTYVEKPELLHEIWGTPDSVMQMMDHSGMEDVRFIGLLAQDVEEAAKESGFDFPGIEVPRNSNEVYSLRYTDFIMPVIKAVQEQQAIIAEQQQKIDQQQLLIEDLLRRIEAIEAKH